jgi:hypothetical protein
VERRPTDPLDTSVVEWVVPFPAGRVCIPLAAHVPDIRTVVGRSDRSFLAVETPVGVEPWASVKDDHVEVGRQSVSNQAASGARTHDADVRVDSR